MNHRNRIVTKTPLQKIWDDKGDLPAKRGKALSIVDIQSFLENSSISFVVANIGTSLNWIPADRTHEFWNDEAREHLSDGTASLADFPDSYCYFASLWTTPTTTIILLEKHH